MAEYISVGKPINSDATNSEFKPLPNLDYKYGPYKSMEECLQALLPRQRSIGLTVGIIKDTGIQEYWFKKGIEDSNLIPKLVSSAGNQGIDKANILIQETAPEDTNVVWGDTSEEGLPDANDYLTLVTITEQLRKLQQSVDSLEFARKNVIAVAPLTSNTKLELTTGDKIKPSNSQEPPHRGTDHTEDDTSLIYPNYEGYNLPNAKAIIVVRVTKNTTIMNKKKDQVLDGEFVYAKENKKLYLKIDGSFLLINGGGGGKGSISSDDLDTLSTIGLTAPDNTIYRLKVDNNGKIIVYKKDLDNKITGPTSSGVTADNWAYTTTLFLPKLYINSVYCGGKDDEHSYNYCSHNFVELSNLTDSDINLNGLSLQYSEGGTDWKVLPLWGTIKKQSTFLIRGNQCSVLNVNTTRIKVTTFDMEWDIKFSDKNAKFFLTYGTDPCTIVNPFTAINGTTALYNGYIDLVGFTSESGSDGIDAYERSSFDFLSKNRIMTKYYTMDPVVQATRNLARRNNSNDWYFIDLNKNTIDTVDKYVPKASFENKNIFYNKHLLNPYKPNLLNVTFGIKATPDAESGATRCFNWVSVGYYDEYLWLRKVGDTNFTRYESFKEGDGRTSYTLSLYNRIRSETTDGTPFTTHKLIIPNLSKGTYEYKVGRNDNYISDLRQFEVKEVINNNFTFVQVSDQQGFNADEYKVWKQTADYIALNEQFDFTINTGDMTQNGNRVNEWLDYFEGRVSLRNYVEMSTVGNNDLCPSNIYKLGNGADSSKLNPINMEYFYTFEIDERNVPIFRLEDKDIYVCSLYSFNYGDTHFMCVNSEITEITEKDVYGLSLGGQIYTEIKKWMTKDIELNRTKKYKVMYTHEMPFTIMIRALIVNYYKANFEPNSVNRGGSHLNINSGSLGYWASTFCQENDIKLVIGGHKHTYSQSYPLEENPNDNMKPYIQVTNDTIRSEFNSTILVNGDTEDTKNYLYPKEWLADNNNSLAKHLCAFKLVNKITAPTYVMCQSSGYKHTSNKELPSPDIPWLGSHYYPCSLSSNRLDKVPAQTVNAGQKNPFYIVWKFTSNGITGYPYRVVNIFTPKGKFNVNIKSSTLPPTKELANGSNDTHKSDLIKIV